MMYSGVGLQTTLRESDHLTKFVHQSLLYLISLEINYVLSVDAQIVPSRVRLTQEVGAMSTGSISGTLTLVKGQQMCVNTTAILEVSFKV